MTNQETNRTEKGHIEKEIIVLAVIIVLQIVFITLMFAFCRQGYHSDELWNYGYANSYDRNQLYTYNGEETNIGKWTDSNVLWEYITVEKEHRFAYASVYQNAAADLNPPFQYMILHTISSLFPGVYSRWFCYAINVISLIVIQIYLFKLTKSITKNKYAALAACILFGFGTGAMDMTMYLRIYALAIAFAMMFTYYSHELYALRNDVCNKTKQFILVGVSCFLGCFTLHLFLVYAFSIVLCYVLYYLFSGKFKLFFQYGLTAAGAVALSFLVFPSTVQHVFGSTDSFCYSQQMYPSDWQTRLYFYFMTRDLFGVSISAWPQKTLAYVGYAVLIIAFFLLPFCFIFRNEQWFHKTVTWIKEKGKDIWARKGGFQFTLITLSVTIVFLVVIAANRTTIYGMGAYANRYIFLTYPIMITVVASAVFFLLNWFMKKEKIKSGILVSLGVLFAVLSLFVGFTKTNRPYFFEHTEEGITLTDIEADGNCLCFLDSSWLMTCLPVEIGETNTFFVSTPERYQELDYFNELPSEGEFYIIIDQGFLDKYHTLESMVSGASTVVSGEENVIIEYSDMEILEYLGSIDFARNFTYVGCDEIFSRELNIYRVD